MTTKKEPLFLGLLFLLGVVAGAFTLHRHLAHVEPQNSATEVPPGVHAALRQLQVATLKFWQEHGRLPGTLDELVGINVPPSSGAFIPFTKEGFEQELGSNSSGFVFLPALVTEYPSTPTHAIVVAYAAESVDSNWFLVLFSSGEIRRMPKTDLNVLIDREFNREESQIPNC